MSIDRLIGRTLGPYQLTDKIGEGGMGTVYKAHEPSLNRTVAIKILAERLARNEEFVNRFYREARAVAQLDHPGIVTIHHVGHEGDLHYIAMQYIEGQTLADIIRAEGTIETGRALEIARQAAGALAAAHSAGIIHRDMKPENVMIDTIWRVKVMDFGIARVQGDAQGHQITGTGQLLGTPAYMSPEQCRDSAVDARSDIYSLGVIIYEMLTGAKPFNATQPLLILGKIVNDPIPPMQQYNRRVPLQVVHLVERCMAKDPDERFAAAALLIEHIDRARQAIGRDGGDSPVPGAQTFVIPELEARPEPAVPVASSLRLKGANDADAVKYVEPGGGRRKRRGGCVFMCLLVLGALGGGGWFFRERLLTLAEEHGGGVLVLLRPSPVARAIRDYQSAADGTEKMAALEQFRIEAGKGDALARMWEATITHHGIGGRLSADPAEADRLASPVIDRIRERAGGSGAEQDTEAVFMLASACHWGIGTRADPAEAARWYELGAEAGHAACMFMLGGMYAEGEGGLPADAEKARSWRIQAARAGNAAAREQLSLEGVDW